MTGRAPAEASNDRAKTGAEITKEIGQKGEANRFSSIGTCHAYNAMDVGAMC
jgi:hypothetical protein